MGGVCGLRLQRQWFFKWIELGRQFHCSNVLVSLVVQALDLGVH